MRFPRFLSCFLIGLFSVPGHATVFATIHGVVHDAQHHPVTGAKVTVAAADSGFSLKAFTADNGTFAIANVPLGVYRLSISAAGYVDYDQPLTVTSSSNPVLHIPLAIAGTEESVTVSAKGYSPLEVEATSPTALVSRADIDETPGATRTLGMQMITDFVPGSYMSHNMLHIRGGHQTSWLIDGVSIPNTKIASNVGPQIDPKDIDEVETQRGSYQADVGDRTYGIFNVLPRNGFERDHEAELLVSGGNLDTGEAQLSFGDHTSKTAWYLSGTGSRSNYGLETPIPQIRHDSTNSESVFASLLRNQTARDQLRLDAQFRNDFFQIPYDPDPNDWEQTADYYNSYGLRDRQRERDSFAIFNWVRTLSPKTTFEVAPFYHFNQANYDSPANDFPVATTWHQTSNYVGAQADVHTSVGPNNFTGGLYSFFQRERDVFGLRINDDSFADSSVPDTTSTENAGIAEFHFSDQFRVGRYVSLYGGMRISSYHAALTENAAYPRIGATVEIPHLHWAFRGYYGHYFQPAPVQTVSSTLLDYVHSQPGQNAFVPIPSERDEEHQLGITIPWRGWTVDINNSRNRVNNFLDHANVGESNIYFPISVDGALVRPWELAIRSPQLAHFGQFHLAYSNQIAQQRGSITGGFTCSKPGDEACSEGPDYVPVDHDQRHTLNTGFTAKLPMRSWFASNVYYGSGFANGLAGANVGPYNGPYLPAHTTFDSSFGHSFGERLSFAVNAVNVTNHRVLQDNSITVGGFHFNDPRMISGQVRYRFKF
ncbi:TonB-dependent receptor [Occallatibacter savannae]|uniref:TonB-dependent receptor n=1 Tax=Occallatibacter savannae TaxID=1002691 RepID=UPI000D68D334|nr:TonB-dependent receptor [Occallatibacter savannae]